MAYALVFLGLGAALAWLTTMEAAGPAKWFALWPSLSFLVLAAGYAGLGPGVLGKGLDGRLAIWARFIHAPYFALTHLLWHLERLVGRESAADEVAPGVWVGRRPRPQDCPEDLALIVDLTAEFPRHRGLEGRPPYRVFPTLDATPPSAEALEQIAALAAHPPGPILFHCASGHGRSATAAAAYLLAAGRFSSPAEAEAAMKQARPRIGLNRAQRRALSARS